MCLAEWPCGIAGARKALGKELSVAAVPGSSFFHEPAHNLIRFHFAKRPETLEAAGRRLIGLRERAHRARERA
jgi:aminotransferase